MRILLTSLLCLSSSVSFAEETLSDAEVFITHNIIHIMHHEAGHALIDQFQLPVLGQEEDAADAFATIEVLDLYEDPKYLLADSIEANFLMQDEVDLDDEANYFGMHDLDIQRGYRIACVAVGTNKKEFAELADLVDLPDERRESCQYDAAMAWDSFGALREGIMKKEGDAPSEINVIFEDAGDYKAERELLERSALITEFQTYLANEYDWPRVLTLKVSSCGEENAFYDPEVAELTLCYEMVRFMATLEKRRN